MKYPIGIQDFSEVITGGYTYADKTRYVRMLIENGKYYFLSRPRRFGKSLFLSTLQAYFEGRRDLFKGLEIDSDDVDWVPRPVIKLSLNTVDPRSEESLYETLNNALRLYENKYGFEPGVNAPAERFQNLIMRASTTTGKKVAVLIDEYDAPLLNTLENDKLNNTYRDTLRSVFSVIKNSDEYLSFAFITGVSRFSHTTLFSGANNLKDISMDDEMADVCGISEKELRNIFMLGIHEFAIKQNKSDDEMLNTLKENYDGYHFSQECSDVYNPFSLLNALHRKKIDNYWFSSGTPNYLLKALRRDEFFLPNLDCIEAIESELSARESYLQNPVALMYETGYLTIKEYDVDTSIYTLGLPNKEVSKSFSEALIPIYSGWDKWKCNESFVQIRKAVLKGEPEKFMQHLRTFLEGNPYGITELEKREKYFQNNIYLVFKALGFMPHAEEETCRSRMDLMLRTPRYIYIFELKTNGNVKDAMAQIEERGYALPYVDEGKQIITIAANYSTLVNNIDSWEIRKGMTNVAML